ncbi:MAG: hypothetical protein ABSA93_35695 [Streptosporangiaceae bacterium]|jgi:hypothetical protein
MTLGYLPVPEADDGIEFFELTAAEWELRRQATLASVGVTYEELEAQALRGYFDSWELQTVWLFVKDRSGAI